MRNRITILVASLLTALALALPAAAAPPAGVGEGGIPDGIECQQAGISTLQSLDLLSAVAGDGIEVVGVGVLPFQTVLELHRTSPGLFQTGGVSVMVGDAIVSATWCDGI